jgi:hypothetical protein
VSKNNPLNRLPPHLFFYRDWNLNRWIRGLCQIEVNQKLL